MSVTATQSIAVTPSKSGDTPYQAGLAQSQEHVELEERVAVCNNAGDDVAHEIPAPSRAVDALERWNNPPRNVFGLIATYTSFFILGLNDASLGVSACLIVCSRNTPLTIARH